ncbi:crotonobetaine/carnitine-CoA ligase [Mycobacterium sp. OAS707]|uniref:AMP-binding protein n=1 Tax=Mycobacterium sp. OAS707 TaxID=2663822 RepID=UPI00178A104D|nr:crotonobetaine/carnitine-CoA ligase [Mycobacterium sp. OAS707]
MTSSSAETLPAIVNRMAKDDPDRTFIRTVDGESATWGELQSSMDEWAARFVALGVQRGDVVVTILDAGLDSVAVWLGLASLGAIDAATNPEFRGRMLAYAINNCAPALLVVAPKYVGVVETVAADLQSVEHVLVIDGEPYDAEQNSPLPGITRDSSLRLDMMATRERVSVPEFHDIACITYTSGTTGPSKAVKLPWGQLHSINSGTFPIEDLTSADVFYCTTSHAHFGSKSIPYNAAMVGGQVVMRSRFALISFWDDVLNYGITTGMLVGSMADVLLRNPESPTCPTSLKNVFMAPLGANYREFSDRFGVRICTVYNSTEGGVAIRSGWNPSNSRTVGRLRDGYPGFEVRLVDANDYEVADGTVGECVVRSRVPWVMNAGYLNNDGATATAWRNGWFHTGDALVRTPDGDYIFVDRLKDAIRRRGENISSFEVEAEVLRNSEIVECAAVAVPADSVEDEVMLFAVRRQGSTISPQDLYEDLQSRMTRFMIPRYLEFVDELPKTQATLRVIKADLRRRGVGPDTWDGKQQSPRTQASAGVNT